MAETIQTLEELSSLKPAAAPQPPKYVQKLDKQGRAYATGKRKDAVARVWIKMGAGKIVVNERPVETYLPGRFCACSFSSRSLPQIARDNTTSCVPCRAAASQVRPVPSATASPRR